MKITSIGGIPVGRKRPLLIVEAGVNHEGSLKTAFEMVDRAAEAGADAIKFQSYKAETLASRNSPAYWDQTKEPTPSQFALFKKHDSFGDEEYRQLAKRCEQKGILFMSTPFDAHFVDSLDALMPAYKIASADLTNVPLLRQIAWKGKPILLSTGAAYVEEIEMALQTLAQAGNDQVALLHCVLEYPCPVEHCYLDVIRVLARDFPDRTLGWSDHVPPQFECLSLLTAWMRGADILEKHYTLDKQLPGNDHYHAMDPDDIKAFRQRQEYMTSLLGEVTAKTVMPSELDARKYARRSLVAARDLKAGTTITPEMLIPKRPGLGISPFHYDRLLGRRLAVDVAEDAILQWDMLDDQ
jgi:sialic acid synthase SpsE